MEVISIQWISHQQNIKGVWDLLIECKNLFEAVYRNGTEQRNRDLFFLHTLTMHPYAHAISIFLIVLNIIDMVGS